MAEIIDNEEIDRDTIEPEILEQQFSQKYKLLTETAVSVKKSYIKKLHGTKSLKLGVSQSDNSIEVYELNNTSLSRVCRLSGHGKDLSEVVFSPKEDHLIYSSGQDGVVKLWDTRDKGKCVQEYKDEDDIEIKPFDCMDVSCNGRVLCAGSLLVQDDAFLVFWDQHMPKPLGGYWNSHTDDVSQVRFHPEKTEILASGSLDGLLNIYNILEPTEDDALTYSLNVENSVERISWVDEHRVASVTQSNELQLWNTDTGDLVQSYSRDKIARSIKRSKEDDCYLVDTYTPAGGTPTLLAGSYGGNGDVLRSVSITEKKLQPCTDFRENKQTVRCCWYEKDRDLLVTAGESGLISVWSRGGGGGAGGGGEAHRAHGKLHAHRHKPY
ncbi:WD repeat-containing protein 89 [Pectinophora gossypiella]|uniref:WD repeat-containing protein 89 n=1 Tax=Pectinophora gossypiella TaxID=13191 RepID=UPI00214F2303|nr:WD repeat-containing protein 89 [Pectinophora gossypiella]